MVVTQEGVRVDTPVAEVSKQGKKEGPSLMFLLRGVQYIKSNSSIFPMKEYFLRR